MGIEDRKLREKEEKKDLILQAAIQLFHDEGIDGISIRGIAEKIEHSPATVYLYFKDKGEIIHALHVEGFNKLYSMQLTTKEISEPLDRLIEQGRVYMKFAIENKDYYDLMFIAKGIAAKIYEKQEWDVGMRSYDYLRQNVKECIQKGYWNKSEADTDTVTFGMWSYVHGMASLFIRGRCSMIPEEFIKKTINESLAFLGELIIKSTIFNGSN